MIGNLLGYFEKPHFYLSTAVSTFWATFGEIWATFYSNIWSHWAAVRLEVCGCTTNLTKMLKFDLQKHFCKFEDIFSQASVSFGSMSVLLQLGHFRPIFIYKKLWTSAVFEL